MITIQNQRSNKLFAMGIVALLLMIAPSHLFAQAGAKKPVLLYSRYFNAKGESRYLPDGTYRDVLARLGDTFEVRVNDLPLNAQNLKDVKVVLIANPSDRAVRNNPAPPHVSPADVEALSKFVHDGGGLIAMGNQEGHNLEIKDFNHLLEAFGMREENNYTDAKKLVIPKDVPIIGGLRWAYYTGNQVVIDPQNPAHPRPLVMNDLHQKPVGGPRDAAGALLAIADPGKGHVAVVTDSGWITNDVLIDKGIGKVAIKGEDNWEIFLRLTKWAAGLK